MRSSFQQPEVESLGRAVCASVWFYAQLFDFNTIRNNSKWCLLVGVTWCDFFWQKLIIMAPWKAWLQSHFRLWQALWKRLDLGGPFTHIVQSDLFWSHAKEKYNFTLFDRGWFHWICVLHSCIFYFFGSKRFAGLQMWTCQQSGPQSSSHGVIGVVMPKRFTDNRMGSNANPVSTMCTWNTWAVRKTWLFEY